MSIEYAVIIQARMGSSRSPGKVSHLILGREMLYHQVMRLLNNGIEQVIVATSTSPADDRIPEIVDGTGARVFRGSEQDVMNRFYRAAKENGVVNAIRTGGDDPLIDPKGIQEVIRFHRNNPVDFAYSSHRVGWIYGTACELITTAALEKADRLATSALDREHIITFIKNNPLFSQAKVSPSDPLLVRPDILLSVDYKEDIELIEQILIHFSGLDKLYTFTQAEMIALYDSGKLHIGNKHLHTGFD